MDYLSFPQIGCRPFLRPGVRNSRARRAWRQSRLVKVRLVDSKNYYPDEQCNNEKKIENSKIERLLR
jgi:hypothetical protein